MRLSELGVRLASGFTDFELYASARKPRNGVARLKEIVRNGAIGLGLTSLFGRQFQFVFRNFKIPFDLANMTGGGAETWEAIALGHMRLFELWCPGHPDHQVLEIGCGVGRDAITRRHGNFTFHHLDVKSDMYNPAGKDLNTNIIFTVARGAFDRIFLHSVFTHMFREDIAHYLVEIRKALAPSGKVMASRGSSPRQGSSWLRCTAASGAGPIPPLPMGRTS